MSRPELLLLEKLEGKKGNRMLDITLGKNSINKRAM